jgi:hypothetical protein
MTKAPAKRVRRTTAEPITHTTPNQIFKNLKQRGVSVYYEKVSKALAESGMPAMKVPSSARGGVSTLYDIGPAQAWEDAYVAKHGPKPATAETLLSDNKSLIVEVRALRKEVAQLQQAVSAMLSSVADSSERTVSLYDILVTAASNVTDLRGEVGVAMDEINGTLQAIHAAEKDEKVTLDNVLDILTAPAAAGDAQTLDAALEQHDDVRTEARHAPA